MSLVSLPIRWAGWIRHLLGKNDPDPDLDPATDTATAAPAEPMVQATGAPVTAKVPRPTTEAEVVAQVVRLVRDLEPALGHVRQIATEVRSHGRSRTDVMILARDLVAVEVKLSDWKRAFGQAVLNTTVVDASYVAMWSGYISLALVDAAEEHGIGIIAVHPDGLKVVVPARTGTPDPAAKAAVLERLADGARSGAA